MRAEDLLGTWRLVRFTAVGADGMRKLPYGQEAQGLLVYAADGWMSAVLSRADRGPFASESMERAGAATADEKVRAFDGYTSYAGRYAIDGEEVRHTVAQALVPTMVGQTLRRRARLEDGTLSLSYEVQGRKQSYHYELVWRRP